MPRIAPPSPVTVSTPLQHPPQHTENPPPKGAIPLGEHFYLFQGPTQQSPRKLIISAHAAYFPGMNLKVPGKTSLIFYGPDGHSLQDPTLGAVARKTVEIYEKTRPGGNVRNYMLGKYQEESYNNIRYTVNNSDFDVLTVRNRKKPSLTLRNITITLQDALTAVNNKGLQYQEIHASFCRPNLLNPAAPLYRAPLREGSCNTAQVT
ncbi:MULTISPECIES: putative adhesin [Pseudomonas]|uniref:putative adhesin n=1 Tax=Pseudomonas TaxID=286 RepID=UPI0028E86DD7|nr:hypothetical protein [Pseudomonas grimontii]